MENEVLLLKYGNPGETAIHPLMLAVVLVACIAIFFMKRHQVAICLLLIGLMTPLGQKVVVFGLNFMVFRILLLVAWVKVLFSEKRPISFNAIDAAVLLWVISYTVAFTLLWQTSGALVNRLGFAYNTLGIYFLFRLLIRDFNDMDRVIRALVVISVFIAGAMLYEQITGMNLFSVFGGVPEFTPVRAGRLRSQAAFEHAILAGSYGATVLPLFVSQWWRKDTSRKLVVVGVAAAVVITAMSASSGPMLALACGIAALMMWPFRNYMRVLRWAFVAMVVMLHLVMKAPVWALIARVGVVGGSSGYHRFSMVDNFIRRFDEWWLLGTKSTDHWGWMMWDTCNQYVSTGVNGGLVTLILMIAVIAYCFRAVGRSIMAYSGQRDMQRYLWAFGSALFAHVMVFFGISYFDQSVLPWYMLLAMISTAGNLSMANAGQAMAPMAGHVGAAHRQGSMI